MLDVHLIIMKYLYCTFQNIVSGKLLPVIKHLLTHTILPQVLLVETGELLLNNFKRQSNDETSN